MSIRTAPSWRVIAAAVAGIALAFAQGCMAGGSGGGHAVAPSAAASVELCDQFAEQLIGDRYLVRNNRFGSQTATQCITPTDSGFVISRLAGSNPVNQPKPVGYPSVLYGCFFSKCTPGTALPAKVGALGSVLTSVDFGLVDTGSYNASYDIFLDPSPEAAGAQRQEVMIHFYDRERPAPRAENIIGDAVIGGLPWQVQRYGPWANGSTALVYMAPAPMDSWGFDIMDFIRDVRARGFITDEFFLNSIHAGFECWTDCVGASVNSFSVDVG